MAANERQHAAGRDWAAKRRRYAPTTPAQATRDHEADEAHTEARSVSKGGNR